MNPKIVKFISSFFFLFKLSDSKATLTKIKQIKCSHDKHIYNSLWAAFIQLQQRFHVAKNTFSVSANNTTVQLCRCDEIHRLYVTSEQLNDREKCDRLLLTLRINRPCYAPSVLACLVSTTSQVYFNYSGLKNDLYWYCWSTLIWKLINVWLKREQSI